MSNPTALLLVSMAVANLIMINGSESLFPVLSGPTMAYLSSRVVFRCVAPDSSPPVTYELIKDGRIQVDLGTDLQGGQPASFFLKVAMTSGGSYHCRARADMSTGVSNSIRLTVVIPPSGTRVTSDPFPPVAYEGSRLILSCNVSRGSHLFYSWFHNRREVQPSSLPLFWTEGNTLVIQRVRPDHAGQYACMAWSTVQDIKRFSSSTEVQFTVKVYVSKPQISLSISKEDSGYQGNITCSVSRGSLPVNFTFLLNKREVNSVTASDSLLARFSVAIVPGQEMGKARCRAQTELQDVLSEPLTLEVVPVGGHIKVQVEYLYRADYKATAAQLSCQMSQGTFPFISWLHNGSVLPSDAHTDFYILQTTPSFAFTNQRRTLVLAKLGPDVFGYYRCKARDSYDDAGPWVESEDVLVQVIGSLSPCLKALPTATTAALPKVSTPTIETISIAFCIFLLLVLVMSVACVYKIGNKRQENAQDTATNLDQQPMSTELFHSRVGQDNIYTRKSNVPTQIVEITV